MAIGTTAALIAAGSAIAGGAASALSGGPDFRMNQQQGTLGQQGANLFGQGSAVFGQGQQFGQQGMGTLGQAGGFAQSPALQSAGAYGDLASLLQGMQQSGGQPSAADTAQAQGYAGSQFAQQRVNLQQSFDEQIRQANRQAALSGRGTNDPILRAKLGQEQMRQGQQLGAAESQFANQYAQQIGQQRLGYAEGRVNALTSLDALLGQRQQQNFQNLFNLGNQQMQYGTQQQQLGLSAQQIGGGMQQQDWQQRYNQASGKFQADSNKPTFGGVLSGAIGGLGTGLGLAGMLGGSGGAPTAAAPSQSAMWGYGNRNPGPTLQNMYGGG